MSIPRIRVGNINSNTINIADNYTEEIPNVYVPSWMYTQPSVDNMIPPVVINIGNPIVNIPGCVEAHKDNKQHKNNIPKDKDLVENDPDEIMTLCDAGYPSYNSMNYEPDQLLMTYESEPPPVAPPPEPDLNTPETPEIPKTKEEIECPGPQSLRIGAVGPSEKEKVIGHELQKTAQGTWVCVELYEPINIAEQYLPSAQVATTTATIAVVATSSALLAKPLADLLLKVVKPAIKQVMNKVNKALGKTPYKPTQSELKTNEYRVKKGLLGINFAKRNKKKK